MVAVAAAAAVSPPAPSRHTRYVGCDHLPYLKVKLLLSCDHLPSLTVKLLLTFFARYLPFFRADGEARYYRVPPVAAQAGGQDSGSVVDGIKGAVGQPAGRGEAHVVQALHRREGRI